MKRLVLSLVLAIAAVLAIAGVALAQPAPQFNLGFKTLADQIPGVVGQPLESEHWGANGDSLQQTTTGLMAWRKADNWTAFTNGARTWINGPSGVQNRDNNDRFAWEKDQPSPAPQPATAPSMALPIDKSLLSQCTLSVDKIHIFCNLPVGTPVYATIDGNFRFFKGSGINLFYPVPTEGIYFYIMDGEATVPNGDVKAGDLVARIGAATMTNSPWNFSLGLGKPLPAGALGPGIVGGYADLPLPSFITDLAKPWKP